MLRFKSDIIGTVYLGAVRIENERKQTTLKSLKMENSKLRNQITQLIEQHGLVQQSINRLHDASVKEDAKLAVNRKEYESLCAEYEKNSKTNDSV